MAIGRLTSFAAGAQTHQAKQPDTQIFVNLYFYLTTTTKKKGRQSVLPKNLF